MAARTIMRCSVFITEPFRPFHHQNRALFSLPSTSSSRFSCRTSSHGFCTRRKIRACNLHFPRLVHLSCSYNDNNVPASADDDQDEQGPPQEAVLKAISEVSKTEGRVGQTTNVVIGGTVTDDSTNEWLALDQKVNSYPTVRGFTAIGTGGDDFVQAMVVAVESVIQQPIPEVVFLELCSDRSQMLTSQKSKTSEFCVAFEEARACGAKVILGDRSLKITKRRTYAKMTLSHKIKWFFFSRKKRKLLWGGRDDVDVFAPVNQQMSTFKESLIPMGKKFPAVLETYVH